MVAKLVEINRFKIKQRQMGAGKLTEARSQLCPRRAEGLLPESFQDENFTVV